MRWALAGVVVLILVSLIARAGGDGDRGPTCGELRDPQRLTQLVEDIEAEFAAAAGDDDVSAAERRRLRAEERRRIVAACAKQDPGERPDLG